MATFPNVNNNCTICFRSSKKCQGCKQKEETAQLCEFAKLNLKAAFSGPQDPFSKPNKQSFAKDISNKPEDLMFYELGHMLAFLDLTKHTLCAILDGEMFQCFLLETKKIKSDLVDTNKVLYINVQKQILMGAQCDIDTLDEGLIQLAKQLGERYSPEFKNGTKSIIMRLNMKYEKCVMLTAIPSHAYQVFA